MALPPCAPKEPAGGMAHQATGALGQMCPEQRWGVGGWSQEGRKWRQRMGRRDEQPWEQGT